MAGKNRRAVSSMLAIMLIIVLLSAGFFTASCSSEDEGVKTLIGLSQPNLSDNLQLCIKTEIQNRCEAYENVRCISYDAGFNYSNQSEDILRLLQLGIDALVVVTVEPDLIADAITQAFDAGIPVIIIGYAPSNGKYTTRVYTDNVKVGRQAGDYVRLLAGDDEIVMLEILGDPESMVSIDLKQGFKQAIQDKENIHNEYVMTGYWSQDKTLERMTESDFKSKAPPIDLIFAQNDSMAIGASLGILDFGREITIIGVGGYPVKNSDLEALKNGQIDATFSVPTGGNEAVDTVIKLLDGEVAPRQIELTAVLVNSSNINQFNTDEVPADDKD